VIREVLTWVSPARRSRVLSTRGLYSLDKKLRAVSGRIVLNLSAFKASAILGFRIFQIAIPSKIQTQSCVRTGVPLAALYARRFCSSGENRNTRTEAL
jgi:hypothetical protein